MPELVGVVIDWREPVALCVTTCNNLGMKSLDQARAVIAGAPGKRVATDIYGRILVSRTATHLLARRAVVDWWNL